MNKTLDSQRVNKVTTITISGGGGISILPTMPIAPTEGQVWLLHPDIISLTGTQTVNNGAGNFIINVTSTNQSDYLYFSNDGGHHGLVQIDTAPMTVGINITAVPNSGLFQCRSAMGTLWSDVITAINNWSAANLHGAGDIISLSDQADGAVVVTELVNSCNLTGSNGNQPDLTLYAYQNSTLLTLSIPSIPTYLYTPYPLPPIGSSFYVYTAATQSTGFNGQLMIDYVYYGFYNFSLNSTDPVDLALFGNGYYSITWTYWDQVPAGTIIVSPSNGGSMIIQYSLTTTWDQFNTQFLAWLALNLSVGATYSSTYPGPGGMGHDYTNDPLSINGQTLSLNGNGQPESMYLYVVTPSGSVKGASMY